MLTARTPQRECVLQVGAQHLPRAEGVGVKGTCGGHLQRLQPADGVLCSGRKPAVLGRYAPSAPIQKPHAKPIYYGKRRAHDGAGRARTAQEAQPHDGVGAHPVLVLPQRAWPRSAPSLPRRPLRFP
jgi:hypothetical protein